MNDVKSYNTIKDLLLLIMLTIVKSTDVKKAVHSLLDVKIMNKVSRLTTELFL